MIGREALQQAVDEILEAHRFADYGPNGLQVEGRPAVATLATAVTASLAAIEAAAAAGADALLVHHGLFWRGHDGRLTGWLAARVRAAMQHGLNIYAYHLPLDAHPQLGNNACFGRRLAVVSEAVLGARGLVNVGRFEPARTLARLAGDVETAFGRAPLVLPGDGRPIARVAWCTGGAQDAFVEAIAAGADAYLTGEVSEAQAHLARETGVAFLACGHHASERDGVRALGAHLAERFGLVHLPLEIDNPA